MEEKAEQISRMMTKPVVLIGLMGVGKTKLGRGLAQQLNVDFFDSDDEIEAAAGMDIPSIFEKFGEDYFREGEARVVKRLLQGKKRIISTGGGAVMTPGSGDDIFRESCTVWVRAEMPLMVERTSRRENRPLLKDRDSEDVLRELAEKRYPVYEKADIVIESHEGPVEAILNQFQDKIYRYYYNEALSRPRR